MEVPPPVRRKVPRTPIRDVVGILVLLFGFATVWLFYFRGGIEEVKVAWSFFRPIVGAIVAYWFAK